MRYRKPFILAAFCSLSMLGAIQTAGSFAASAMQAQSVSLADAAVPPTEMVYLYPNASVTYADPDTGANCPNGRDFFTDVSAYTWRGTELSGQRWNADHTVTYWRDRKHGGRVTFDGITFRNRTHHGVLVAGWCEA